MNDPRVSHPLFESAQYSWLTPPVKPAGITKRMLERVLDAMEYGIILVNSSGEVLLANPLARRELDASSCIRLRNNKVSGTTPKAAVAIERAIIDATNGSRHMVETTSSRGNLLLSFAPLFDTFDDQQTAENCAAQPVLVQMGKRKALNPTSLAEFARIRGISNAEKRLLPAICEGASIKEMARQQGISTCTVRVQLKSIRHKTGACSLRALLRQLMALPPIPSRLEM